MQRKTLQNRLGIPQLTREQMGPEITERVRCARLWCQRFRKLLYDPRLNSDIKFYLYKVFVRPILTYGCELWCLSEYLSKKILRFENGILVEIYKSKYPAKHPKRLRPDLTAVYRHYREKDVVSHVNRERLCWTELLKHEEKALNNQRPAPTVHWWDRRNRNDTTRKESEGNISNTMKQTEKLPEFFSETDPSTSYMPDLRINCMDDAPG